MESAPAAWPTAFVAMSVALGERLEHTAAMLDDAARAEASALLTLLMSSKASKERAALVAAALAAIVAELDAGALA